MTPVSLEHAAPRSRVKHNFYLVITFTNSLDSDQARQHVGSELAPNLFNTDGTPKRIFWKKNQQTTKKHEKIPCIQIVIDMQCDYIEDLT